jgi:hypothetical protein
MMLMLAQFQKLIPNGSIITELVQIFQGKYIVRASVQIENITRATGMAGAETVEAAEDQARARALMVLGISDSPQASVEWGIKSPSPVQSHPGGNTANLKFHQPHQVSNSPVMDEALSSYPDTAPQEREISLPPVSQQMFPQTTPPTQSTSPDLNQDIPVHNEQPEFATLADNQPSPEPLAGNFASNIKPFTPRSYSNRTEDVSQQTELGKKNQKSEPVDLSDVIAKTDVELQRLGWTAEQGREHLIKTYGKRGRTLLTEEELYSFLKHLESLPDPVAGF